MALRRLVTLTPLEWLLLVQLGAAALVMDGLLRLATLPRLSRWLQGAAERPLAAALPLLHRRIDLTRLAVLCSLAASAATRRRGALIQSFLLLWLVRARGRTAELLIGIDTRAGALPEEPAVEPAPSAAAQTVPLLRL